MITKPVLSFQEANTNWIQPEIKNLLRDSGQNLYSVPIRNRFVSNIQYLYLAESNLFVLANKYLYHKLYHIK